MYICLDISKHNFKSQCKLRINGEYEPFVYIIKEIETGIKYIGSRTGKQCLESDIGNIYFTSSKEFKWTSDEFEILEIIPCISNHIAIILESELIEQTNAVWDSGYYNKSRAGKTFNSSGCKFIFSDEHKNKLSNIAKKREVNINAISAMQYYTSNSKWMKNPKTGKDKRVEIENIDEYKDCGWELGRLNVCNDESISKWKSTYHSNPDNKNRTFTEEHKRKIGESSKGTVAVIDNQGNKFKCSTNDPKYISGEYQHVSKGRKLSEQQKLDLKGWVTVKDKITNETFRCALDDPKYISGEYVPAMRGETITCPHCQKVGGKTIMKRWHFDNCKVHKEKYIESNTLDLP